MSRKWRALVLACVAQLGFACAKTAPEKSSKPTSNKVSTAAAPDTIVARVADRAITRSYYEERLAKMDRRFLPDTLDLAGKRKFLDFIINKELMAIRAEEMKYDTLPGIAASIKLYEENTVANTAIEELCKGKIEASEQDIQAFQERKSRKILTKYIVVRTRKQADDLRQQLVAGADFDKMADKHSQAPRKDDKGKKIPLKQRVLFGKDPRAASRDGYVLAGEVGIPVEEAVYDTPLGEVSQPVWTAYGWNLFKPISVAEVKRAALDGEARHRLEIQVQMHKKRRVVEDYYEDILREHGFRLDEDALNLVYDKLPKDLPPEQAPAASTEKRPVIPFTAAERAQFLFEVDGKQYTLGSFSNRYDSTSWFERPKRITGVIGIRYWIRDRWLRPLQMARARRNGVDKLPAIVEDLKVRREQMMVSSLHETLVGSQSPEPTEAQILAFYEKHKAAYVDREKRRCNLLYNPQEKVVRRAYDEIKAGADFVETAVRYNEGSTKPEDVKTPLFTRDDDRFGEISDKVFALEKGQYTEPLRTTNAWVVVQLDTIVPELQLTMEQVRENIVSDFKAQWSEDKLNELLAQWKQETQVSINDAALEKVDVRRTDVFVPGRPAPVTTTKGGTEGDGH